MKMENWIRQGDVILDEVEKKISGKAVISIVLAEGEVTGHKHTLRGQLLYAEEEGQKYVDVFEDASLTHEEHDTLTVPKGTYRVLQQREVDLVGEVRQVTD